MKKFLALTVSTVLVCSALTACGGSGSSSASDTTESTTSEASAPAADGASDLNSDTNATEAETTEAESAETESAASADSENTDVNAADGSEAADGEKTADSGSADAAGTTDLAAYNEAKANFEVSYASVKELVDAGKVEVTDDLKTSLDAAETLSKEILSDPGFDESLASDTQENVDELTTNLNSMAELFDNIVSSAN